MQIIYKLIRSFFEVTKVDMCFIWTLGDWYLIRRSYHFEWAVKVEIK